MIKTIKTFIAVAALSGTVSANVHAEEVTVTKGDTLWDLSNVHSASVENIKEWNKLQTDLIHPGDVLMIPTEKHYLVKDGDTLWDIANEHTISINQLKEWNRLTTDTIKPGLNLVIYENMIGLNDVGSVKKPKVINQTNNVVKKEKPSAIKKKPQNARTSAVKKGNSKTITVKATAYTASCKGCSGITATGVNLKTNPNAKVISVDPSVIPLGSKVYVEGYGYATAADTGGKIKGNRIDVFVPSKTKALNWGARQIKVKIVN